MINNTYFTPRQGPYGGGGRPNPYGLPPFATHGTINGPSIPPVRGGGFQQPAPMSEGGDPMGQVEFGPSTVAPIFNPPAATGGMEPAPGFNPQTGGGFQLHPGYGGMGMGGGPRPFAPQQGGTYGIPPSLFGSIGGNPFMGLFGGGFNPFMGGGFNPFFGGGFQSASPYRRRGMFSNFMGGM